MAAARVVDDIDEKFCQCCVCFEQYKKPRQLQCLYRYCTECLEKMIAKDPTDIKCPLCQEKIDVPKNGVEGSKSDFYMIGILDYIKVKKSLKKDQILTCGDCSKQTKSSAYCFKCTDFLCEDCHEYHLSRKSLQEHRPHILSLEDVEAKNITLGKLSILKEAPRCQTHPQNQSQLCCKSCANRPICLTCTYGEHRNHDMYDVTELAKSERKKLPNQKERN
ncbi:E3 ubiquitin-protein ligase TRIM56-like [Apostichopus japonicus]|uniref:E3 ubiquitin-protein ligase TRIM56-like n=1 Tax=Stichopus japonicus TaxID=307972 RepID=UPI003AB366B5